MATRMCRATATLRSAQAPAGIHYRQYLRARDTASLVAALVAAAAALAAAALAAAAAPPSPAAGGLHQPSCLPLPAPPRISRPRPPSKGQRNSKLGQSHPPARVCKNTYTYIYIRSRYHTQLQKQQFRGNYRLRSRGVYFIPVFLKCEKHTWCVLRKRGNTIPLHFSCGRD